MGHFVLQDISIVSAIVHLSDDHLQAYAMGLLNRARAFAACYCQGVGKL